ncbi:MAG: Flp pilus assembly protein CpaB [Alphaproteobacteria bacterium]|nr:Flp pilus assembly protein CpaB [Alphaproteobacteria bacterium]MCB9691654.1 Flp pilus assembly protein CpaB [Alphaproteobacteria bacterium]
MAKTSTGGRLKAAIFLLVSLFAAAIAALVIFTVIRNFQEQLREVSAPPDLEMIVVAKRTIWPGETITDMDLETKEFPPDFIPEDVLATRDLAVNRVPVERILASEFIRVERLAAPEAGRGLPAIVPRGMRAIALDISGGSAVAGFLNPGNYVDLIVTAGEPIKTRTLFQAVTVLAVNDRLGARIEVNEEGERQGNARQPVAPSVTVAVTPDQAETITHAHIEGVVTLTLRNDIDVTNIEENPGISTKDLLDPERQQQAVDENGNEVKPKKTIGTNVLSIDEYRKRISDDGTLIIIKGDDKQTQKVRTE